MHASGRPESAWHRKRPRPRSRPAVLRYENRHCVATPAEPGAVAGRRGSARHHHLWDLGDVVQLGSPGVTRIDYEHLAAGTASVGLHRLICKPVAAVRLWRAGWGAGCSDQLGRRRADTHTNGGVAMQDGRAGGHEKAEVRRKKQGAHLVVRFVAVYQRDHAQHLAHRPGE
jgi:hypothetical protein